MVGDQREWKHKCQAKKKDVNPQKKGLCQLLLSSPASLCWCELTSSHICIKWEPQQRLPGVRASESSPPPIRSSQVSQDEQEEALVTTSESSVIISSLQPSATLGCLFARLANRPVFLSHFPSFLVVSMAT